MRTKLEQLREKALALEPKAATRSEWNQAVQAYADQFMEQLPEGKAYRSGDGQSIESLPFEAEGKPIEQVLELLRSSVDAVGINPASGGHLGYIPGGGVFPTALGDYLAAVTNRYAGIYYANPGAVRLENRLLRWMCEMVGYPADALGNLASGGSIANLIAVTTARDYAGIKAREVERSVIYLTEQVHHCVQKALRIAGLGEAPIRYIPMDGQYRMQVEALEAQLSADRRAGLRPFLVVASAGTTDVGAVDPLDAIATLSEKEGLWMHVDAAYGGFFMLLEEKKSLFKGIERSDSVAIDPHKGLFLSYGLGVVLIRNVRAQYESHYYRANYMQDSFIESDQLSPADLSPELTKHFRGLRMWLSLQLLGVQPFRDTLEEKCLLARYFHERIQELGFEVGPVPELSVVIYRYLPKEGDANAFNQGLVEAVLRDGRVFVSSTTIDGVYWIRLAVLSFRTHLEHIDYLLDLLETQLRSNS